MARCPKCLADNPPAAQDCTSCGAALDSDLFDLDAAAPKQQAAPALDDALFGPQSVPEEEAALELDLPEWCTGCGAPLRQEAERIAGVCARCRQRADRLARTGGGDTTLVVRESIARPESPAPVLIRPAPDARAKLRRLWTAHPRAILCGAAAALVLALGGGALLGGDDPTPAPNTGGTTPDERVPVNALLQRPPGVLTPAEAVAAVARITGGAPPAASGDPLAQVEARLARAQPQSGDVEAYIEEMSRRSGSDGSAELAALDAKLDSGGTAPGALAQAKAAIALTAADPKPYVRQIENLAASHRADPGVRLALAEVGLEDNPAAALAATTDLVGPSAQRVRGMALAALGRPSEALGPLRKAAPDDATAARALIEVLARGGRCREARPVAQRLARQGGAPGAVQWVRYLALCEDNPRTALEVARGVLALPGIPTGEAARVSVEAAMVQLWRGAPKDALASCNQAHALDPGAPATRLAMLRCQLAQGQVPREVPAAQGADRAALQVAAELAAGRDPGTALERLPSWTRAGGLLRAVRVLALGGGEPEAIGAAVDALLTPGWDGSPSFPLSAIEMMQLAALAPEGERNFTRALAETLGGQYDAALERLGDGDGPDLLRAVIAAARGARPEVKQALKRLRRLKREPLVRYLDAWAETKKPARKRKLAAAFADERLGPHALLELHGMGESGKLERARERWPRHPLVARVDLASSGRPTAQ